MPEAPRYKKGRNSEYESKKRTSEYESKESKDNKMMILLLIGIMLVLIVLGVVALIFLFVGRLPPPSGTTPGTGTGENITGNLTNATGVECDDSCFLQQALAAQSPDLCLNITDIAARQDCYILLSNTSVSVCLKLDDKNQQKSCVISHATLANDISLCSLLGAPEAAQCMAAVNPCYAANGTSRLLCLALASRNYTICDGNKECVLNYSQETGDIAACDLFAAGTADQYGCWAVAHRSDMCSGVALQSQKDLCYEIYAIGISDKLLCNAITPDSLYMYECLSYFAISMKDLSICDTTCAGDTCIKFNNRWQCYSNYSLSTQDISGCNAIDALATSAKFRCYYDYAKLFGDPSVCDQFGDPSQINSCYVGAIYNNTRLNYTHCAGMSLVQWRNNCYTTAARNMNDSSICNYIDTESEKNSCIANVNQ